MTDSKILIVEDRADTLELLDRMLQSLNYAIAGKARSGEEALEQLEQTEPDLILMDITLQGQQDGIEIADQIRETRKIPVIYLTGALDNSTIQRAKDTDPYGYLVKPISIHQLGITIQMALHQHELEQELRQQERWLSSTLRSISDGVITTDDANQVTFLNRVAEDITAWSMKEALGRPVTEVINLREEEADSSGAVEVHQLDSDRISARELFLSDRNGETIPVEISGSPIEGPEDVPAGSVYVVRDITERRRARRQLLKYQEQLRSLASTLFLSEERERRRVANILHESIGQMLSMATNHLTSLQSQDDISDEAGFLLTQTHNLIQECIDSTRSLTLEISPPVLNELGFRSGVRWLLDQASERHEIETALKSEPELPSNLDKDLQIILFRALQEVINKAVLHGEASEIGIDISHESGEIRIQVDFNGTDAGWDESFSGIGSNGEYSLFNIKERLEYMQGELEVITPASEKTRIVLNMPLGE